MKPRLANRMALAGLLALLVSSPLLAGCVQVQVTDEKQETATPTPYGELVAPREERDWRSTRHGQPPRGRRITPNTSSGSR